MDATQIKNKIRLLGEAGLRPHCLYINWYQGQWHLTIHNAAWLTFGMPQAEIIDWLTELAISQDCNPFKINVPQGGAHPVYEGVTVSGGMKSPDLIIPLPGALPMLEQYEALFADLKSELDVYAADSETIDPLNMWLRCCFSDYQPPEWHELRAKAESLKKRRPEIVAGPVHIIGRQMIVKRPCGCVTEHWRTPGKTHGRDNSKARLRFANWLAKTPCLKCDK